MFGACVGGGAAWPGAANWWCGGNTPVLQHLWLPPHHATPPASHHTLSPPALPPLKGHVYIVYVVLELSEENMGV